MKEYNYKQYNYKLIKMERFKEEYIIETVDWVVVIMNKIKCLENSTSLFNNVLTGNANTLSLS